jgi:hypothetical protein
MKEIPAFIKTREDLQNLHALAMVGKVGKGELAAKARGLYELQYQRVPIIGQNGDAVTTRYFPEVTVGDTTVEGYEVTGVAHIEAEPDEGMGATAGVTYDKTVVTLSTAPEPGIETLAVYRAENYLAQNGFDIDELSYIMGVLENE